MDAVTLSESSATESTYVQSWRNFFQAAFAKDRDLDYRSIVNEVAARWPDDDGVPVDFRDLHVFDEVLAEQLLRRPDATLADARVALSRIQVPTDARPTLHVRPFALPEQAAPSIRNLNAEHVGSLVSLRGLVRRASGVEPDITEAWFMCERCGAKIMQKQELDFKFQEPLDCYEDQGGCSRNSKFKLLLPADGYLQASRIRDLQRLEIQEAPEGLRGGEQPQRLKIVATDRLCRRLTPGDRATVVGVLRAVLRKVNGQKSTTLDRYVEVVGIHRDAAQFEDLVITPEDEEEIRAISRTPLLFDRLANSVAPSIHGFREEKKGVLLQLFGGVAREHDDGTRVRGDIHVLMVGDPGVAKSEVIAYANRIAPRGVKASGKGASAAGLTASVVKDEDGGGRWTVEAGAMVLAHGGLFCLDEMDKMDKGDVSNMHEGMEQQVISINKAGVQTTLQSKCAVLAAANPTKGRFDDREPIFEQIDLPPALLSRFDLIYVVLDVPDMERDRQIADHILRFDPSKDLGPGVIPQDMLRKYVAFAKDHFKPELPEDVDCVLKDYWVDLRMRSTFGAKRQAPIGARQLVGLRRLAQAHARMHLRAVAVQADADAAVALFSAHLASRGGDVDLAQGSMSSAQRGGIIEFKQLVRTLGAGNSDGVAWEDILVAAAEAGIDEAQAVAHRDRLKRDGDLAGTRDGWWRVV